MDRGQRQVQEQRKAKGRARRGHGHTPAGGSHAACSQGEQESRQAPGGTHPVVGKKEAGPAARKRGLPRPLPRREQGQEQTHHQAGVPGINATLGRGPLAQESKRGRGRQGHGGSREHGGGPVPLVHATPPREEQDGGETTTHHGHEIHPERHGPGGDGGSQGHQERVARVTRRVEDSQLQRSRAKLTCVIKGNRRAGHPAQHAEHGQEDPPQGGLRHHGAPPRRRPAAATSPVTGGSGTSRTSKVGVPS